MRFLQLLVKIYYIFTEKYYNKKFLSKSSCDIDVPHSSDLDLLLITVAFNNPQILEWQLSLCKKFIRDKYIHIILDNSSDNNARGKNKQICLRHNIQYIPLPNNPWSGIHNSRSHGISLDWAVKNIIPLFSVKVVGFLDHDIFPVKEQCILSSMEDKLCMGVRQVRGKCWYLWPGFLFIAKDVITKNRNFSMLPTSYTDTGGALWKILFSKICSDEVKFIDEKEYILREGCVKQSSSCYLLGDWLHSVNASYWKKCAPKEDSIKNILQNEFGCVDILHDV